MAEPHAASALFAECLEAMVASGNDYPCDTLAPVLPAECALPAGLAAFALQDHHATALTLSTERT